MTILATGIPVARMELLDDVQMAASIAYSKLEGLQPVPTLFFEFDGTPAGVARSRRRWRRRSPQENGASRLSCWATDAPSAQEAVAGAARRLLGGARLATRRAGRHHGRDRPGEPAGGG